MSILTSVFRKHHNKTIVVVLLCGVFITSLFTASPSIAKYVNTISYTLSVSSADSWSNVIPLTNIPPTYDDTTVPTNPGLKISGVRGTTVTLDGIYYVLTKDKNNIWNDSGTLKPRSAFLQINDTKKVWDSYTTTWNTFRLDNAFVKGDILEKHSGPPDAVVITTYVVDKDGTLNDDEGPGMANSKCIQIG